MSQLKQDLIGGTEQNDPTRTLTLACVDIVERRGLASSSRPFVLDIHDRHGLDREADFHPAWGV